MNREQHNTTVITVTGASAAYNGPLVLDDINLKCTPGEVISFIGRSGVGKTTLLRLVAGLLPPVIGHVDIFSVSPDEARREQRVSFMFQHSNLFPWLTARQNVGLALRIGQTRENGILPTEVEERVSRAMIKAQILDAANKFPGELSGGMKTRVALARSIVGGQRLLLLDEPFTGLDEVVRDDIYTSLQEILVENQITVLLATHNLVEAISLSDRVMVLASEIPGRAATISHIENIRWTRPRVRDEIVGLPEFRDSWHRLREAL